MKALVTGCAGFIGSHLTDELLRRGYEVKGIDCFADYYPRWMKESNLRDALANRRFEFMEANILDLNLKSIVKNVDYVFHAAAQAGVRKSWGGNFKIYVDNNILVTQQLLEACKGSKLKKFVFASSSSVYGDTEAIMREDDFPKPVSPYGASKLACESLCYLYWKNYRVPVISLRYFTVYGERQRPDMAFHKFIRAILDGDKITVYGNGEQTRSFTYVGDVVDATLSAAECSFDAEVINVGGVPQISVNETIGMLQELTGIKAMVEYSGNQKGDVRHTHADIAKSMRILGYKPKVGLREGLQKEVESIKALYWK